MAELLLFHHAHGLTSGVRDFAERLRRASHTVHLPDLYESRVFDELEDGVGYAERLGFDIIIERGVEAADGLPGGLVYGGFSLGVLPAQKLAQLVNNLMMSALTGIAMRKEGIDPMFIRPLKDKP